jgi:O-antigen/teichoic acid export membrane protein
MAMSRSGVGGQAALSRASKGQGSLGFVRDIGMLLVGSSGAQLLTVLTAPLLARIYAPSDFAALALMVSTFQIISRFSSFKYETALATGKTKPEMGALAALATRALIVVTVLTALSSSIAFTFIESKVGFNGAIGFCIALPLVVLFDGMIQIVITWAVRWREFFTVSSNDLVRNGASVSTQAAAGLAGFSSAGLLFGQVMGTICAFAVLLGRGSTKELRELMGRATSVRRGVVARRFADFPMFQMPKAILNALGRNMPTLLVAIYFSATSTGLFFFAVRLTTIPAQLISGSLGRVLLQRFAQRWTKQRLTIAPLLLKSTAFFLLLAAPLVIVVFTYGEDLFVIFLGEKWRESGSLAAWTVVWSAATIVGTPAQMAMTVMRQNRIMLILEAVFLPLRLLPFVLLAPSGELDLAVAFCCVAAALFNLTMICVSILRAIQLAQKQSLPLSSSVET